MATDLAEFLGAALGFYLLFGVPLWIAAVLTAIITLLILALETYGFRPLEAVITAMVGVIAVCYLIEIWLVHPDWAQVAWHSVVPQFAGRESVFLADRYFGRNGYAACDFPAFVVDSGTDCNAGRGAPAAIVPVRDSGRGNCDGSGGID